MVTPEFGTGLAIIEPSAKLHKLQLALARSIVLQVNNRTECKLMNPTDVARFLRRKTPLGIIRNLEIFSVSVITDSNSDTHETAKTRNDNEITLVEKLRQLTEKGITLEHNSMTTDRRFSQACRFSTSIKTRTFLLPACMI